MFSQLELHEDRMGFNVFDNKKTSNLINLVSGLTRIEEGLIKDEKEIAKYIEMAKGFGYIPEIENIVKNIKESYSINR